MFSNIVSASQAKTHPTYVQIKRRMMGLGIDITKYFDPDVRLGELKVYESALDGISFKSKIKHAQPDNKNKLDLTGLADFSNALRSSMVTGKNSFREGNLDNDPHIAVDASMGATVGTGFREIIYLDHRQPVISASQMTNSLGMRSRGVPKMNAVFSSHFGSTRVQLDITSLHCAVAGDFCSIHIDHTGFVLGALPGMGIDVIVTPDALQHTLVELLERDILGIPDGIEIYAPNSRNDFGRFGLRGTAKITDTINFSIEASYSIRGKKGFAQTIKLDGQF